MRFSETECEVLCHEEQPPKGPFGGCNAACFKTLTCFFKRINLIQRHGFFCKLPVLHVKKTAPFVFVHPFQQNSGTRKGTIMVSVSPDIKEYTAIFEFVALTTMGRQVSMAAAPGRAHAST